MKLGMHASAWCERWSETSLFAIDEAKKLGVDFIEIPLTCIEDVPAALTGRKLKEAGLEAVTFALILNPEHDIASVDETVRKAGVARLKECVRLTREMGADFFGGVLYSWHMNISPDRSSADWLPLIAAGLREVARYASMLGGTIGLEPINRYETSALNTCVIEPRGPHIWRRLAPDNRTLAEQGIQFLRNKRAAYFASGRAEGGGQR